MPIIKPEEYPTLKAQGLIRLAKQPDGKIRVTIDRGEMEESGKAVILSWLAEERKVHSDAIAVLDTIKADVDPL